MFTRRQFMQTSVAGFAALQLNACTSTQPRKTLGLEQRFDQTRTPSEGRPKVASGPIFNVRDFGALGDGVKLDTASIQQSIDKAHAAKGGKVWVPAGVYLIGSIELKSNVELHLTKDATLLGVTDVYQYQRSARGWLSLIVADHGKNIAITGTGSIDGQGRETALAIDHLHHSGKRPMHNYNQRRMRPNEAERPELIDFVACTLVRIYDVNMYDAASWVQTYEDCEDVYIDNIKVVSDAYWNNDGIDIENCRGVNITHSFVNSADDAICIKSSKGGSHNNDIYVGHCITRSSSNGIKFGTSSKGGFKNVVVEDIQVFDTYRSAVCVGCVDGGFLHNVSIRDIYADNTANAFVIRLGHRNINGEVGSLKNVEIKNLTAHIPFGRTDSDYELRGPALNTFFNPIPASITGLPGHLVENIHLENIQISYPGNANTGLAFIPLDQLFQVPEQPTEYPEYTMFAELPSWGLYVRHAKGITLKNVKLSVRQSDFRPAYVFDDVEKLECNELDVTSTHANTQMVLHDVMGAKIVGTRISPNNTQPFLITGKSSEIDVPDFS